MLAHIISAILMKDGITILILLQYLDKKKYNLKDDKIILNNMVGFRNCLSHEYLSLEVNVLTDIVNNLLNYFNKFLILIKNYCKI